MNGPNSSRRMLPCGIQGPLGPGGKYGYLKAHRVAEAAARWEARSKRSAAEQIRELDARLGVGVGAKKERALLLQK